MAEETRTQLYAKILANLPDNTTEQITPATDRAVEDAEVESCYNLLDDNATNVNYNPTNSPDWLPEGDPTEVGEGLDILAARTGTNLSQNIAYVSNVTTVGVTPEVGNPLKPFPTILAAWNAVPNNSIVVVLGGTYTETINLPFANSTNKALVMSGVSLTGNITISGNTRLSIIMESCNITGNLFSISNTNSKAELYGTNITGTARLDGFEVKGGFYQDFVTGNGSNFEDLDITYSGTSSAFRGSGRAEKIIVNAPSGVATSFLGDVYSSEFNGVIGFSTSQPSTFYDCEFTSPLHTIQVQGSSLNASFYRCRIETTNPSFVNVFLENQCNNNYYKDCTFVSAGDNIKFGPNNVNRAAGTITTFEDCRFLAGPGGTDEILVEPTSGYQPTDAGRTLFSNCVINKASVTGATPKVKVDENNTFSYTNLT
jgi:hypothetical protein